MRGKLDVYEANALSRAVRNAIEKIGGGLEACVQWYTREPDVCIAYIAGTAHGLLWFRGVRLDVLDVRLDNEVRRQINEGAS